MPPPGPEEQRFHGQSAAESNGSQSPETSLVWARSSLIRKSRLSRGPRISAKTFVRDVVGPVESHTQILTRQDCSYTRLILTASPRPTRNFSHFGPVCHNGVMHIDDVGILAFLRALGKRRSIFRAVALSVYIDLTIPALSQVQAVIKVKVLDVSSQHCRTE